MKLSRVFLQCLLFAGTVAVCHAQLLPGDDEKPPVAIGVLANYHRTNHTISGEQLQGISNCCPDFASTDGTGIAFGALFEYPLSNALRLTLRGSFQNLKTTFTASQVYGKGELDNNVIEVTTEKQLEANLPVLMLEPDIAYRIFGRFDVHVGVQASYLMSPSYTFQEQIVSSNFVFASTGSKTRNKADGDIPHAQSMMFSGVAGVSYDFNFGRNILSPEVRYTFPFTTITDGDWKTSTLHVGAAFKIPLRPALKLNILQDTVYRRDTSVVAVRGITEEKLRLAETTVRIDTVREPNAETRHYVIAENYIRETPKNDLALALNVMAYAADGSPVSPDDLSVEEIESTENIPLLPYVFFPVEGSDLAQTVVHKLTSEQANRFTIADMPQEALAAYPDMLNLVGYRLRNTPSATITIKGCNSDIDAEKNNKDLSRSRAEAVRDYLVSVWNIDQRRITIEARNLPAIPSNKQSEDGQQENRRAEITSSNPAILAPLSLKTVAYRSSYSKVRIVPTITADAGIRSWEGRVVQDGKALISSTSSGNADKEIIWNVNDTTLPKQNTPVQIVYAVTDNIGQTQKAEEVFATRHITVKQKRAEQVSDNRIERYRLIMFDFNSSSIPSQDKQFLQTLAQRLQQMDKAKIAISGYTDRTGSKDYNLRLAQRRCEETQKLLKIPAERSTLDPVGNNRQIYDNNSPEGRFFSRTVEVVVETPVDNTQR